jgi:hypothetical protein
MGRHPRVSWLIGRTDHHPDDLRINRFVLSLLNNPILHDFVYSRVSRNECWNFWEHHCLGFRRPFRDLIDADVTPNKKNSLHRIFEDLLSLQRPTLLAKLTGWPRIRFLKEVFPDAKFVHIIRDPRATAFSLMNIGFWWGWQGPQNWRFGPLPTKYEEIWVRHNKSFVSLAGIAYMLILDAYYDAKPHIPEDDIMEIRYEDFCEDHMGIAKQITNFFGLEFTPFFEQKIRKYSLDSMNFKYKEGLTPDQIYKLNEVTLPYIEKFGYQPDSD